MNKTLHANPVYPPADIGRADTFQRAHWAIASLLLLAFGAFGLWLEVMPTFSLEPLDLLPAVITLQVVGAVVLAAWLLWSPA
jgi:hypothetical protein